MKTSHTRPTVAVTTGRVRHARRCSLCRWRRADVYLDTARQDQHHPANVPAPTWSLCLPCHAAVQREVLRARLRSPDRLLIAIGIVAAERAPTRHFRRLSRPVRMFSRPVHTLSRKIRQPLSKVEADLLFLLMMMFVTITGLIVGLTALAFATSRLF